MLERIILHRYQNGDDFSSTQPRYGPVSKVNENIRSLFTETPLDFIANCRKQNDLVKGSLVNKIDNDCSSKPSIVTTEDEFVSMISVDHGMNGLKHCNECGFKSYSSLALFNHMGEHLGQLAAECDKCHLKLSSLAALEKHTLVNHNKMGTVCAICREEFSSIELMFIHMNIHRKCKSYHCPKCPDQFPTFNKYKRHLKVSHEFSSVKDINILCNYCNLHFYTSDQLLIHRVNENHNSDEGYVCRICGFLATSSKAFICHILSHSWLERENNNLAVCLKCKKLFFSSFMLKFHMVTKHNEYLCLESIFLGVSDVYKIEEYECQVCNVLFFSKQSLIDHIEALHSNSTNVDNEELSDLNTEGSSRELTRLLPLSCNICGRRFLRGFALSNHMRVHESDKAIYECEECGFMYEKRNQVLEHIHKDHSDVLRKHLENQEFDDCKKVKSNNYDVHDQNAESIHSSSSSLKMPATSVPETNFLQQSEVIPQDSHPEHVIPSSNIEWNNQRVQNVTSGCQTDAMYNLLSLTDF